MTTRTPTSSCGSGPTASSPDDPLLHACVAAYASDLSLYDTILGPHEIKLGGAPSFMGASLDHCMWFHQRFRADEWLLYDTDSPTAIDARGLARGFFFDRDGPAGRLGGPGGAGPFPRAEPAGPSPFSGRPIGT